MATFQSPDFPLLPFRSDEDYLLAVDTTRWLPRVGELLFTAQSICHTLVKEGAHALVCYEAGWDRTTQVGGKSATKFPCSFVGDWVIKLLFHLNKFSILCAFNWRQPLLLGNH